MSEVSHPTQALVKEMQGLGVGSDEIWYPNGIIKQRLSLYVDSLVG